MLGVQHCVLSERIFLTDKGIVGRLFCLTLLVFLSSLFEAKGLLKSLHVFSNYCFTVITFLTDMRYDMKT